MTRSRRGPSVSALVNPREAEGGAVANERLEKSLRCRFTHPEKGPLGSYIREACAEQYKYERPLRADLNVRLGL